jgi:hypothetical protein
MALVALARFLPLHRRLVAAGVVLAVVVGVFAGHRADHHLLPTGIATGRVLIDQQPSLATDLAGKGTETIGARTVLLGDLLATDTGKQAIARAAGLPWQQVSVAIPSMAGPISAVPLPAQAAEIAAATQNVLPYGVTVISTSAVPILTIVAHAPTVGQATRLVDGATVALRAIIAQRTVSPEHAVVANPIGRPYARVAAPASKLPPQAVAPIVALVIFGLWCGGLLVTSAIARAWRGGAAAPGTAV